MRDTQDMGGRYASKLIAAYRFVFISATVNVTVYGIEIAFLVAL